MSPTYHRLLRHVVQHAACGATLLAVASAPVLAQTSPVVIPLETVRAIGLRDLRAMHEKFIALAESLPDSAYDYRPMDGVRSTRDVIALIIGESYGVIGGVLGVRPPAEFGDGDRGVAHLKALTSKQELVRHLRAATQLLQDTFASVTPDAELAVPFFDGTRRPFVLAVDALLADQHEHLGQLIAYARAAHVVPPWSRTGAR